MQEMIYTWAALIVVFLIVEGLTAGLASIWFALGSVDYKGADAVRAGSVFDVRRKLCSSRTHNSGIGNSLDNLLACKGSGVGGDDLLFGLFEVILNYNGLPFTAVWLRVQPDVCYPTRCRRMHLCRYGSTSLGY